MDKFLFSKTFVELQIVKFFWGGKRKENSLKRSNKSENI